MTACLEAEDCPDVMIFNMFFFFWSSSGGSGGWLLGFERELCFGQFKNVKTRS